MGEKRANLLYDSKIMYIFAKLKKKSDKYLL